MAAIEDKTKSRTTEERERAKAEKDWIEPGRRDSDSCAILRPFLVIDMFTDYEEQPTVTRRPHLAASTFAAYTRGLFVVSTCSVGAQSAAQNPKQATEHKHRPLSNLQSLQMNES